MSKRKLSAEESISDSSKREVLTKKVLTDLSLVNANKSVSLMVAKSDIHILKNDEEQKAQCRGKIRKWFEDIYKSVPELLDIAAACNYLKIFFNFESKLYENPDLSGLNGNYIFIGAKLSDKQHEQKIKGVLAHELCHFVMEQVYYSQVMPYYDIKKKLDEIARTVDRLLSIDSHDPDDGFNGILSSMYKCYDKSKFHEELIARAVQILTEFGDNNDKLCDLQGKYQILFDFWNKLIIADLKEYKLRNQDVIKLNMMTKLLQKISSQKFKIRPQKIFEEFADNKLVIIKTNNPTILLKDIIDQSKEKYRSLIDTYCLFIDAKQLVDENFLNAFDDVCLKTNKLHVFIDCSKGVPVDLENKFQNKNFNYVVVTSNEIQFAESSILQNSTKININYDWDDLPQISQELLLQCKINFQGNLESSLKDLLSIKTEPNAKTDDLTNIIDEQTLNSLVNKQSISVNTELEDEINENHLEMIYIQRLFINRDKQAENQKLSETELISEVKNKKFVLISDQAGNGKTLALKKIAKTIRKQYPTKWVTYVDLKQLINEFKAQECEPEFSTFIVDNILKPKTKIELEIFKKCYNDGNVLIFFDGFDEIAPDCAEFVTKLAQNFKQNGGNQLWIATRDYLEVDLKKQLNLDCAYGLEMMNEMESVYLIAKTWTLMDLKCKNELKSIENLMTSLMYQNYRRKAYQVTRKVLTSNGNSVGLPLWLNMIADISMDVMDVKDLKRSNVYAKLFQYIYQRQSKQKGIIREKAYINSQFYECSFYQFHQYLAIKITFPELVEKLFPAYDGTEWPHQEVIAGGVVNIINGKLAFTHNTFCEFFLAEFITKELKRKRLGKIGLEIFVKVLTSSAYRGTQIIINDAVVLDPVLIADHGKKFLEFSNEFCKMDNLEDFYVNELECLVVMIVDILKSGKYEKVKELLTRTAGKLIKSVKSAEFYLKFEEFLFNFLKSKDLKTLIKEQEVLLRIVQSELDISIFESLVIKLESKFGREFIQKIFRTKSINLEGNILYMMCLSANREQSKVLKILEIIHKYLKSEIIELMTNCNQIEENILQVCVQTDDEDLLHDLWTKIENSLGPEITKELASKKSSKNQFNVLHYAAFNTKIEVHQTLWTLLVKSFKDLKELKNLILEKDTSGFSYLNHLVLSDNIGIVEFTFSILIELFDPYDYNIILSHKDINEQSLLQIVIIYSTNIEVFQHLWKLILDNLGSKGKFLQAIKEVDKNSNNLIHHAASFGSNEIFVFIISKLDSMTSSNEFRNILRLLGQYNQNLLQLAAISNGSIEIHKILWETFTKTFDDLLQFSEHVDKTNENVLMKAVQFNSLDVVQLLWTNISKSMKSSEQISYLKKKCINGLTIRDMDTIKPTIRTWIHKLFENKEISTVDSESSEGEFLNDSDVSMDEGDLNNHLRLIKAVKKNNTKVVENILQNNCVDVNYVDARQQKAIDYAWLNYIQNDKSKYSLRKIEKIMTILLKVNSYYPNVLHDFNYESGNEKTQNFIDFTDQIKAIVIQYPNLKYFTDRNNESVLLHILRLQRIVVKNKIDNQMRINVHNSIEEQPVHILQILSKSTIIGADKKGVKCVLNALNSINIIQHFSIVLQIAACMMINITFNFGHEIDQSYVHQEFPQSATIYVGAKSLLYNTNKQKTLGFILNKLILLVLNLVFMNKSRPYPRNDTELEQNYKSIFNSIKLMNDERQKIEGTIKNVFKVCRDDQEAELIAAAMQAVIQCDNSNEMIRIQQHYKKVFKYLSDVVIPECENVLPVLKLITSSRTDIKYGFAFNCLTVNMQNNIIHKIIRFQGRELTILEFEQIVENFRVLLDVEDLKRIIIYNEILEIGKPLDHVPDQDIVANKKTEQHLVEEEKIVDQIIEQTEQSKLFILSDLPISGKIIDKIAAKLKIKYRNSWVILAKISDLVDNLFENRNNFNTSYIPQCLTQILQLNKLIEIGTFYQLYESGKIIILFDEFESLPDEFINLFAIIFKDFADNLTNMILVSS
ncbi:hypothetical protein ACKWTF_015464 [Chironomus riparius]